MSQHFNVIVIFVTSGLFLACGLMFLCLLTSDSPLLGNYRKARHMMAIAYFVFVLGLVMEYLFYDYTGMDISSLQTITLIIAASQAPLFTLALLALLEVRFPGWKSIFYMTTPAILLITAILTVSIFCSKACFAVAFYPFSGLYAMMLAFYTGLFLKSYKRFRRKMDNYFSDNEAQRLHWVAVLFFTALSIGVMALLATFYMFTTAAFFFPMVFSVFYLYFAFRFINYAHKFYFIEHAMENEEEETAVSTEIEKSITDKDGIAKSEAFLLLEKRIEQWVAAKHFTEKGITIDTLVPKFYTNRHYLSSYINIHEGKSFREWINQLRIEEAQNLLRQYPEMTITEIALKVGFSDKTNFRRHFIAFTGFNPQDWRCKNGDVH